MTTSLAPHPLLIPPDLAKEIGLHEAVILPQIHYWLERSNHLINGCRWVRLYRFIQVTTGAKLPII